MLDSKKTNRGCQEALSQTILFPLTNEYFIGTKKRLPNLATLWVKFGLLADKTKTIDIITKIALSRDEKIEKLG